MGLEAANLVMQSLKRVGARRVNLWPSCRHSLPCPSVTGYVTQEDLPGLAEAGFLDVIRKPFDVDALATAVRSALGCKD